MAEAASRGVGVALVPIARFQRKLASGRLARPFAAEVAAGSYWLTWLKSKKLTLGMRAFRDWIIEMMRRDAGREERDGSAGAAPSPFE